MKLPTNPSMRNTKHGHGASGMAFYSYENEASGVLCDVRRQTAREVFKETWRYRWLPDREFGTYVALWQAVEALTDDAIAAERAKWPQMPEPPKPSLGGIGCCWLHPDRPRTHYGWVQLCWHKYDGMSAMLCAGCAEDAAADPDIIVRASEKRKADVAARQALRALSQQTLTDQGGER